MGTRSTKQKQLMLLLPWEMPQLKSCSTWVGLWEPGHPEEAKLQLASYQVSLKQKLFMGQNELE